MVSITSVFGSAKEVNEAVRQAGLQSEVVVQTPLQLIFGGEDYSLGFDQGKSSPEDLSQDISFIIGASEEALKKLDVTIAPMSAEKTVTDNDDDLEFSSLSIPHAQGGSEEEILSSLESSMEIENIAKDHSRISDVGNRVLDSGKDAPIVMFSYNSVLEKARIDNSSFVNFIFQPADMTINPSASEGEMPIEIDFNRDEPPVFTMNTAALDVNFDDENDTRVEVEFSVDGDYILAESSACAYSIESFTPGILTAVAIVDNEEGDFHTAIYSWEVHSNHMSPLSGEDAREVFKNISHHIDNDVMSEDSDENSNFFQNFLNNGNTVFMNSWAIDSVDVGLLRPSFTDDFSIQLSQAVFNDDDDDDDDLF